MNEQWREELDVSLLVGLSTVLLSGQQLCRIRWHTKGHDTRHNFLTQSIIPIHFEATCNLLHVTKFLCGVSSLAQLVEHCW